MIHIDSPENCCGCSACKSICPKHAIYMEPDALGFLYPKVDMEKCINCGLCEKVCAFNDHYDTSLNFDIPLAFGVRHKDMKEVESSRSGAAFIALSDWVLEHGGSVYGAGYVGHFRVAHKRATTKEERNEFKGSKYVQSDPGKTFELVKNDLKNGLIVMYSGTACQIAGLKAFVGPKLLDNLFLVDIVCHGVPSPYIWKDYIAYVEKKYGSQVVAVNFRDKSKIGWRQHKESISFANGKRILSYDYTYLFYQHIALRKSCATCFFCNTKRPSDVTLADFWGWEKTNPEINKDDKGVSLVLINTPKGKKIFDDVSRNIEFFTAKLENVLQPNLLHPTKFHYMRPQFEKDYSSKGFVFVGKRYGSLGIVYRIKKIIQRIKNKCIRLALRK